MTGLGHGRHEAISEGRRPLGRGPGIGGRTLHDHQLVNAEVGQGADVADLRSAQGDAPSQLGDVPPGLLAPRREEAEAFGDVTSSRHNVRMAATYSAVRAARRANGTPSASNSSRDQPMPHRGPAGRPRACPGSRPAWRPPPGCAPGQQHAGRDTDRRARRGGEAEADHRVVPVRGRRHRDLPVRRVRVAGRRRVHHDHVLIGPQGGESTGLHRVSDSVDDLASSAGTDTEGRGGQPALTDRCTCRSASSPAQNPRPHQVDGTASALQRGRAGDGRRHGTRLSARSCGPFVAPRWTVSGDRGGPEARRPPRPGRRTRRRASATSARLEPLDARRPPQAPSGRQPAAPRRRRRSPR